MNEHDILNEALRRTSPEGRARYLDEVCGSDGELRRRVEELLDAEARVNAVQEPVPAAGRPAFATTLIAAQEEGPGAQIGPYKLLQQIGEGGMGVVYLAEQVEPVVRRVALKIIKPGIDTRQVIARFEAERQALALMDHACIAKVFDAGATAGGRPYFVMELVKGIPITRFCDQQQLSVEKRLQLFLQVCQAVQHAHQKGVIHRDLKPSNVLVTLSDGLPVPKVIDFGLAKATSQRLTDKTLFTEYGQVVGTLEYMSPEQADLNQLDIDTRTDIYSLGALLYELLTGYTPLERSRLRSAAFHEMLRMIREEEPQRPSTRLSTLQMADLSAVSQQRAIDPKKLPALFRGELDWVVMKALDKNRSRRYETANGFARDVERYLSNLPVEARPPSSLYRFRKFTSRHKAGAAATVAGTLVLITAVAGLAVSNWLIAREKEEKDQALQASQFHEVQAKKSASEAEKSAAVAEEQRADAAQQLYFSRMVIANQEWSNHHAARARNLLDFYLPENNHGVDLRGWEWHYLWRLSHTEVREIKPSSYETSQLSVAFTPDGKFLITGSQDGMVRYWSPDATQVIRTVKAHEKRVSKLSISADSKLLATASLDGKVILWNISSGDRIRSFPGQKELYYGMDLSRDGKLLAIGSKDIVLYDTTVRSEIGRSEIRRWSLDAPAGELSFSNDGKRLLTRTYRAELWDVATGKLLRQCSLNNVSAVAFSPDDRTVATGHPNGDVNFWNTVDDTYVGSGRPHDDAVVRIAFNAKGTRMATASADATIRSWDTHDKRPLGTLCGHTEALSDVAFAPQGNVIASCAWGDSVRIWDESSRQEPLLSNDRPPRVDSLLCSPDGECFAASGDGTTYMFEVRTQRSFWTTDDEFEGTPGVHPWAFDSTSRLFASGQVDGTVKIRNARSGEVIRTVPAHKQPVTAVQFFPDGGMATGNVDGEIAFWNADNAKETARFNAHTGRIHCFALSPDGNMLASCGGDERDRLLHLWDARTGKPVKTFSGYDGGVYAAVFSHDGRKIFYAGNDDELRCSDVETGQTIRVEQAHSGDIKSLAITPDGKRLASCSADKTVKLWDTRSVTEVLTLKPEIGKLFSAGFSPDGFRIAAGGAAGQPFKVWDGRPLTDDFRLEQAAIVLVWSLAFQHTYKDIVLEELKSQPSISEPMRRRALALAEKMIVDSGDPAERNNALSWYFASRPNRSADDYKRAVQIAITLCQTMPENGGYQNTLGVAHYRLGDWKAAETAIRTSMQLSGGGRVSDWFFLAMIEWQQGRKEQARKWFEAGRVWRAKNPSGDSELIGFHGEAAALLGIKEDDLSKEPDEAALLNALFAAEPDAKYWSWYRWRAEMHIKAGRWAEAKPDALRSAELTPNDENYHYQLASLLARAGDVDAYRRHCQKLLDQYAETEDPKWAERTAKACLILPATRETLARASKLADRAVTVGKDHWAFHYFQVAAALAAYRRDEFQKSIEWCDKALDNKVDPDNDLPSRIALTHYIRAMALARLGKPEEAKQARDKANDFMREMNAAENGSRDTAYAWHDWAICELLQQELERTLAQPTKAAPSP